MYVYYINYTQGEFFMGNKFCFLKGIVDCDSGRIQDCNNKRTTTCILEQERKKKTKTVQKEQAFCFLMGMVDCSLGRVQDCNIKRIKTCPNNIK